jgi:hypothetical protein
MTRNNNQMKNVYNLDQYNSLILENKISLKRSSLGDDIKDFMGSDETPKVSEKSERPLGSLTESLSKSLRQKWDMKMESDDFYRDTDGGLKSAYSEEFLEAWKQAADKGEPGEDKFFFFEGGIYDISDSKSSLKTPKNYSKWAENRGVGAMNESDGVDFMRNYMSSFKNFGGVDTSSRKIYASKLNEALNSKNYEMNESDDSPVMGAYDRIMASVKNEEVPFIEYEDLKGPVSKAIKKIVSECMKNDDYQSRDVAFLNNAVCLISPCVSHDGEDFISAYGYVLDQVLTPEVMENTNLYLIKENTQDPILHFTNTPEMSIFVPDGPGAKPEDAFDASIHNSSVPNAKRIHPSLHFLHKVDPDLYKGPVKTGDSGKYKTRTTNMFLRNLVNSARVLNKVKTHCKRINTLEAEDVPQKVAGNRCVIINPKS